MNARPLTLAELEQWMQSVIMHPGGVDEGLAAAAAADTSLPAQLAQLEEVVDRSRMLSAAERLEIYVTAYRMRLLECLRAEFSATYLAVGEELFDALAFGYLQAHPSQSYTLGQLGAKFPEFLRVSPVHAHAPPATSGECWSQFVIELARWERLVAEVFDGPGSERSPGLSREALARLQSDAWGRLRLVGAPDLQLATFTHPVHRYWLAVRENGAAEAPLAETTRLAVHRLDFHVRHHELSPGQFMLLQRLVGGWTLEAALAGLAVEEADDAHDFGGQVHAWFADWAALGFFGDAQLIA
jgi:hypothetical protein